MRLLDAPILFTLELHIPATGPSQVWTTPRDVRHLPPETRILIAQHLEGQLDHLFGLLGVKRRYEIIP